MQDETNSLGQTSDPSGEKREDQKVEHVYIEVENDLLSKPNALVDILQAEGNPPTVVFCNTPSEADLVEVVLKKKGITAEKMIGHVPFQRAHEAAQSLRSGEISVLIVTDISARDFDLNIPRVIVNYAIHEDPEIYLHRTADHETLENLTKVLSLVSPLDFGNFHFLKKVVDFELVQGKLPDAEVLAKIASESLIDELLKKGKELNDTQVDSLVSRVLEHENKEMLLKGLIHNTLNEIPALRESLMDNKGRRRRGDRRSQNENRSQDNRSSESSGSGNTGRSERPRRNLPPPKRDLRFYLGAGLSDGFSEAEFVELFEKQCGGTPETVKRFSLRNCYSFVDLAEEGSESYIDQLLNLSRKNGANLVAYKATTISAPREESEDDDNLNSDRAEGSEQASENEVGEEIGAPV